MIDNELIEVAARALLVRDRGDRVPWERWHETVRADYLDVARAVLTAVAADLWAEGWCAAFDYLNVPHVAPGRPTPTPNPYAPEES